MGTIMVDSPPCPEDARTWRATLRNLNSGVNRLLINLDDHYDRTLGARAMDSPVFAHLQTAESFRDRGTVFKGQALDSGADWEKCIGLSGVRWASPNLTFDRQAHLHWDDAPVIVEHHPGPAPGACWVILPAEKVVFIGDLVAISQPPFLENADLEAWIESLNALLLASYKDFTFVSSRGGVATAEHVRSQKELIRYIDKRLKALAGRKAGAEETEAVAEKVISDLSFPREKTDQYRKRLAYGLHRYYLHQYFPETLIPKE
jgi:glyoxylase-like metal-dependent hydrolase (beta-lactamase superfamily II)